MGERICIAFLGNWAMDSRCYNLYYSMKAEGFDVPVISFEFSGGEVVSPDPEVRTYRLRKFGTNLLFYSKFAAILSARLFKERPSLIFAEDIYCLPFCLLSKLFFASRVIYNSRELYQFLAGLRKKPKIQRMIRFIEKLCIRFADLVICTGEMDSSFLAESYRIEPPLVVRNLPKLQSEYEKRDLRKILGIPGDKKIILYQGVVFEGRGIEPVIRAMKEVPEAVFLIIGSGVMLPRYQALSYDLGVHNRVIFLGRLSQRELSAYTSSCDLGLALIENISLSYYYALPNKLFEYIASLVPPIVSNLPQMEKIINDYSVGISIDISKEGEIAGAINSLIKDEARLNEYRQNCIKARRELCWQSEYKKLREQIGGLLNAS